MQNSLCGDQGGLRFNIHADLEEMLITGFWIISAFVLILLLLGSTGQPQERPAALHFCALGFTRLLLQLGLDPEGRVGASLSWLNWSRHL